MKADSGDKQGADENAQEEAFNEHTEILFTGQSCERALDHDARAICVERDLRTKSWRGGTGFERTLRDDKIYKSEEPQKGYSSRKSFWAERESARKA